MKISDESRSKWIALLKGVKFFSEFDNEILGQLLDVGEIIHCKFHDYVFREHDVDYSFFVILKGRVKIIKYGHANAKKEIGTLECGACFGEMGLLLKSPRSASVLSADESFIFKLNSYDIQSLPAFTQVDIYRRFAENLAEKLKSTTEELIRPGF